MVQFTITLDGNKKIYGDENSKINDHQISPKYCSFKDFCLDEILNNSGIIEIKNSKGIYCFPSNRVICVSFYD